LRTHLRDSLVPGKKSARCLETISKKLLRTPENVPADEGATEFEECFVNVGPTLEANAKTTEIVEPCMSAFDHPAKFAETATVFGSASQHDLRCTVENPF